MLRLKNKTGQVRILTFSVISREAGCSNISETVAKHQGCIFHPRPRLLPSQMPCRKATETFVLRKHSCGKTDLRAPRSLQHRLHFGGAEAKGERLGFMASAGIYFFELPCPSSCQVMTVKDSEVASCCSLRKWQAKSLPVTVGVCAWGWESSPAATAAHMHKDNLNMSTARHKQFISSGSDVVRE